MLRLRTFGGLSIANAVFIDGAAARRRPLTLLALLAVSGRRGLSRDRIIAMLWPESDAERGRNSLSRALSSLRGELGQDNIVLGMADLRLNPEVISSDVDVFERHLDAGELEQAVVLYEGDFLDGVFLKSAPDFERWADEQRARLKGRHADALALLASRADEQRDHANAVNLWRRLAALEPLAARSARGLMAALTAAGDRPAALRHFQLHASLLRADVDVEPEPAVIALAERIRTTSVSFAAPPDETPQAAPTDQRVPVTRDPEPGELAGANAPRHGGRGLRSGRKAALTVVMVFGIAVALTALRTKPVPGVDPHRVVVSVFANQTGDSTLDVLGVAVADWVTAGIQRLGGVDVIDGTTAILLHNAMRVAGPGSGADSVQELAEATRAGLVVTGYFVRDADSIVFVARVSDAITARVIGMTPRIATLASQPYGALDPLRERILGLLGLHLDERFETVLRAGASSPPTLASYQEFVAGLTVFQRGDMNAALTRFLNAYDLDSSFVAPLFWASWATGNLNRNPERRRLLEELERHRPNLGALDLHGLEYHHAFSARDYPRALAAVREASKLAPGSIWTYNLGFVLIQMGRNEEAAAAFAQINSERGWVRNWSPYWSRYGVALHLAGDFERELQIARVARIALPNRVTVFEEARALASLGRIPDLDRVVAELRALPDPRHQFGPEMNTLGIEVHAQGNTVQARRLLDESIAWFRSLPADVAASNERRRDLAKALYDAERWKEAREVLEGVAGESPVPPQVIMYQGLLAARQGEPAVAEEMIRRLTTEPDSARYLLNLTSAARIAAVLGDRERAVRFLTEFRDRTGGIVPRHVQHRDFEGMLNYEPYLVVTTAMR